MGRRDRGGYGGFVQEDGVIEHRRAGLILDWWVPVLQAASVGVSLLWVAVSLSLIVLSYGAGILWFSFAVGSLGTYLWHLLKAVSPEATTDLVRESFRSFSQVAFLGVFFYSVWKVAGMVGVSLPPAIAAMFRVAAPLSLVLSSSISALLLTRFVQESLLASPYIEQSVAGILEELGIFWGKKPRPEPAVRQVYGVDPTRARGDSASERDRKLEAEPKEERGAGQAANGLLDRLAEQSQATQYDLVEWLVLGNLLPVGYSRRKWAGKQLSSGTVLTERMVRQWAASLIEARLLVDSGAGLVLTREVSIAEATQHISVGRGLPPPSSERIAGWLENAGIPPHPAEEVEGPQGGVLSRPDPTRPGPTRPDQGGA